MKKSILNLGAQELSKDEQKSVNGGITGWMAAHCVAKTKVGGVYGCYNPSYQVYIMAGWCCNAFPGVE